MYRGFTLDQFMNQCYANVQNGGKIIDHNFLLIFYLWCLIVTIWTKLYNYDRSFDVSGVHFGPVYEPMLCKS